MSLRPSARDELERSRARLLELLAPLDDDALRAQHSPLMSPLVWDLTHVGNYEDLWLVRALGAPGVRPDIDDLYDAFKQPRADRPNLPLLSHVAARAYLEDVREVVLRLLDDAGPSADDRDRLRRGEFVHGMVAQHEHQHIETVLATLQLLPAPGYRPERAVRPPATPIADTEAFVPGGSFAMGTDDHPWALDNERPSRLVPVDPFWIDTAPVTNRAFVDFIYGGGYDDPRHWTTAGWKWRQEAELVSPQFWTHDGTQWTVDRFGHVEPLQPDEPVQHVCWYEADAYARWAGRRLPTETEWEKAATWDPESGEVSTHPWGDDPIGPDRANLNAGHFGPTPAGAYPSGVSPVGCHQMLGDVWEWTSSDFVGHPGFVAFPYPEYSEVFFGDRFKVLRGGSWATDPVAMRATFRNWDFPIRRQIFAGLRTARDA